MSRWLNCFFVFLIHAEFVNGQLEWKPPDPPDNVRAKASTHSITIWWDIPSNAKEILVRGYTLSYGIETPSRKVIIEGVHTNAFTVDKLQPNTTYIFALTAYNEAPGEDSERVLLSATTEAIKDDSATRLQPPTSIKIKNLSPSELLVHWTDSNLDGSDLNRIDAAGVSSLRRRFYILEYWHFDGDRQEERKKLTTDNTKIKLNQLEPGQQFAIRIKIVLHGGQESAWSETTYAKTAVDVAQVPGKVEKCDFEDPGKCDYVSDTNGLFDWVRVPTESSGGHSMLLDTTALGDSSDNQSFGRLLSPVFNLRPSSHVCISLHYFISSGSKGVLKLSLLFEGNEQDQAIPLFYSQLADLSQGIWQKLIIEAKARPERGFQLLLEGARIKNKKIGFKINVDNITIIAGSCPEARRHFGNVSDQETDVDLLVPLENLINTDPRVYRTKGLDGLPAVGIQRGVEIVVPYRIYLPRRFYHNFAFLSSIKPRDDRGGFLFAVVNAFDTIVDLGVKLEPAADSQTNISLIYTDSEAHTTSQTIASFIVPSFTNQWTQLAIEVRDDTVTLYFRCMRYATRQVRRQPLQLQLDDASKLYIANAGPIIGAGFEGEASGDIPQKVEKPQNVDDSRNFEQTNQLPPVTTTPESISIPQSIVQSAPSKTLHLKEAIPTGEEGSRFQEWREYDDSLIVPNFDMQSALKDFGMYGFQESANRQVPHWSSTNTRYQPPAFVFQQQASTASKGEKGDRGEPGVCTQRCVQAEPPRQSAGPPGVPGIQGLKGEKGECIYERSNRPAYESNALPTDENSGYENRAHRYGSAQKGQKGDRGDRGETGARGPPGLPSTSQTQHTHSNVAAGGVKVYQTAVELFSAAPQTHVGSLAFALSDQQLFIRVNNGWQSVKLDSFHPAVERRPTALDNGDGGYVSPLPCVRRSVNSITDTAAGTETQQFQKPPSNNLFDRNLVNQEQRSELDDQHKHHAGHKHTQHTQNTHPENNPEWYNRHQYEVEHEKKLHMIALNDPLDGNLGGVRGADLECYHQARQAGFKTTFRAFLSSRVQDLNKMVYPDDRSTPVYNLRGEKLFDSWNSIFESGVHSAVPILSFNGKNVFDDNGWNDRWIWHGSSSQGNRKLDGFCDIWRSSSASSYGIASPLAQNKPLTFAPREVPCYRKLGILCVENMSQYNVQRRVGKRIPNFYFDNYL